MPQEKENQSDLLWTFFCQQKWMEHEVEVEAWEGHLPTYSKEEYVKKNKEFLTDQWMKTMWPGHILVKPDKSK